MYLLKLSNVSVKFGIPSAEVLQSLERCFIRTLKYSNVFSMYQIELPVLMQVSRKYYCLKWLVILFIGVSRLDLRYCALKVYWSPVVLMPGKSVSQHTPLVCQSLNTHQYLRTSKDYEVR